MGLFDNIRQDILDEFNSFVGDKRHEIKYESNGTFNSRSSNISKPKDYSFIDNLEMKRWNCKPTCPRCGSDRYYIISRDYAYKCAECRIAFNVLTKTVLENTKVELNKWYDLVKYCRETNSSTRSLGILLHLTQKTVWWMIAKLKTNELFMENDVPILNILLSPNPFTIKYLYNKKDSICRIRKRLFA